MKLLLDQGTPARSAEALRQLGWDAVHTREIGLASAEDTVILHRAAEEDRIVVTLDSDFHQLLAMNGARKPSVVRVRIEGLSFQELAELLHRELNTRVSLLMDGIVASIHPKGIRIRRLPLPPFAQR
ncbi:MAG: DUF5615 family PIN-like protein [Limisphaerales bacterium]